MGLGAVERVKRKTLTPEHHCTDTERVNLQPFDFIPSRDGQIILPATDGAVFHQPGKYTKLT
jgi:hypothetical protein